MHWPGWLTRRKHQFPDALAVLGLLAISLILFSDTIIPLRALLFCGDMMQHYTYEMAIRTGLAQGSLPLWNIFFAEPLAGAPQSEMFYPGMVLLRWVPMPQVFIWSAVMHVWLAGLSLYALLRDLDIRRAAALLGAIGYMLSSSLTEHLISGHSALVNGMAWIAWIILFYRRYLMTGRWRYLVLAALAVFSHVLTGHVQWVLIGLVTPVAFGLFMLAEKAFARDWRGLRDFTLRTAGVTVLSAGLLAVYLLPLMEYVGQSARGVGLSYENATTYSVEPAQLLVLATPLVTIAEVGEVTGTDSTAAYTGLIAAGLAALALVSPKREHRRLAWLFVALDVFAVLISLGGNLPGYQLIYAVTSFMRAPSRFTLVCAVAMPILAALGVESLLRRVEAGLPSRVWVLWAGLGIAAVVVLAALTRPVALPSMLTLAVLVVVLWGAALAAWRWLAPGRWAWLMAAAMLLDLGSFTWVLAVPDILKSIPYYELFFQPETNPYLALDIDPGQVRLWGNDWGEPWAVGPALGIPVIGRDMQGTSRYVLDMLDSGPRGALLSASGYRIVTGEPPDGAAVVRTAGQTRLVEMPGNLPRVYATGTVRVVKNPERSLRRLSNPFYDPLAETVVLDPDGQFDISPFGQQAEAADFDVRLVSYQSDQIVAQVEAGRAAMVVFVEPYYPGWMAEVDGRPARVWQVNHAFRGVVVPGGMHTVTLTYAPVSIRTGAWISGVSLLVMTLGTAWIASRRPAWL